MDPFVGQTLEKYEVLEKIGEGGMASVYRGRHQTLGREVAIKILHGHLAGNARNRERFSREARAIESLQHDNILKIFDYSGPDSQKCFIITEFIQGRTLKEVLDETGPIPSEVVARVGIDLCSALQVAHQKGIVHRDVKPENVMIDGEGRVKLMDFGIARFMDESHVTVTGGLVGSPAYMSPEQALEGEVDRRSDLFSLGTLLYRMVTGELPFQGPSAPVVLHAITQCAFTRPGDLAPDMDPTLARLIERCLKRNREDRFPDAASLEAELLLCLRHSGLDPEDRTSPLRSAAFFADPEAYRERLRQHLIPTLLHRARTLLGRRTHAEALGLLNRVLELDPENADVPVLIEKAGRGMRRSLSPASATLALLGMTGLALMAAWFLGRGTSGEIPAGSMEGPLPSSQESPEWGGAPSSVASVQPPPGELTTTPSLPASPGLLPSTLAVPEKRPSPAVRVRPQASPPSPPPSSPREGPGPDLAPAPSPLVMASRELPSSPPPPIPAGIGRMSISAGAYASAQLYLNGRLMGEVEPFRAAREFPSGRYSVEIRGEYIQRESREVVLFPGQYQEVTFAPKEIPARLKFLGVPSGYRVFVAGQLCGTSPDLPESCLLDTSEKRTYKIVSPDGRHVQANTTPVHDPAPGTVKVIRFQEEGTGSGTP